MCNDMEVFNNIFSFTIDPWTLTLIKITFSMLSHEMTTCASNMQMHQLRPIIKTHILNFHSPSFSFSLASSQRCTTLTTPLPRILTHRAVLKNEWNLISVQSYSLLFRGSFMKDHISYRPDRSLLLLAWSKYTGVDRIF